MQKLLVSHFICQDNGQFNIRLMPTFNKQNPSLLKDLFQETIKQQRTWLTLTIIMVINETHVNSTGFPPLNVLHHSCKTFSKKKNEQLLFF